MMILIWKFLVKAYHLISFDFLTDPLHLLCLDRFRDHVQHVNEVTVSKDKLMDTFSMTEKQIA